MTIGKGASNWLPGPLHDPDPTGLTEAERARRLALLREDLDATRRRLRDFKIAARSIDRLHARQRKLLYLISRVINAGLD